jgi:hypothetical protein
MKTTQTALEIGVTPKALLKRVTFLKENVWGLNSCINIIKK